MDAARAKLRTGATTTTGDHHGDHQGSVLSMPLRAGCCQWSYVETSSGIPNVRLRKDAKIELIKSVPLFSRCTKKELAAIAAEADEFSPPEGTNLTRQGAAGRDFVVLVEGSADVKRRARCRRPFASSSEGEPPTDSVAESVTAMHELNDVG